MNPYKAPQTSEEISSEPEIRLKWWKLLPGILSVVMAILYWLAWDLMDSGQGGILGIFVPLGFFWFILVMPVTVLASLFVLLLSLGKKGKRWRAPLWNVLLTCLATGIFIVGIENGGMISV